jgi:pyruvate dehydrogenase E2 component (dihydrolipoyllysine-residue acetyltransferase)
MAAYVTMPQLSDTMSEGQMVKWLKKEGDSIKPGTIIAEVETDKATMEMESFDAGTLAQILVKEGQTVGVGLPIALLATGKETVEQARQWHAQQPKAKPAVASAAASPSAAPVAAAPVAAAPVAAAPVAAAAPAPDQMEEAAPPPASAANNGGRPIRISPLARRVAAQKGIDPALLHGSGPQGRIIQRDVTEFTAAAPTAAAADRPAQVLGLSKMRLTIAKRLVASKQSIPHFYESIDADVEELSNLRAQMNKQLEKENIRISLGDFVSRAVAMALLEHPAVNASFDGMQVTRWGHVHLGMAVAIPDGLIVPVLRNIHRLGVKEIRLRSVDLAERARAQRLKQDEMTGATFTVSNLGAYGIREFSAIINPPEVGILAVGAAQKRPAVRGEAIVARTLMTLTLSADHRVVDGATAAEFLRTVKELLQEPGMMLA